MGLYDRGYMRADGDERRRPRPPFRLTWRAAVAALLVLAFVAASVASLL